MEKTTEPKKIVYIDQTGDCWFVWLNTSDDSTLENSFDNYEDALAFAQGWADGITTMDGVECEVTIGFKSPITEPPVVEPTVDVAAAVEAFIKALAPFFEALRVFNESMPVFVDNAMVFKRLYLGSTYAYNILSRCRFLVKSPKMVNRVSGIIMWVFIHLPKSLILRWPSPGLRD